MSKDNILFEKIKKDDKEAFKQLFTLYYDSLCQLSGLLLNDDFFSEEIVQDVFLDIWERRHAMEIHSSIKHYLFTAVKNKSFNWKFKKMNNIQPLMPDEHEQIDNATPEIIFHDNELKKIINEKIEGLPPQAKVAFKLKYIEGLSQKKISFQMRISENTVEKHLTYARRALRKYFRVHE